MTDREEYLKQLQEETGFDPDGPEMRDIANRWDEANPEQNLYDRNRERVSGYDDVTLTIVCKRLTAVMGDRPVISAHFDELIERFTELLEQS